MKENNLVGNSYLKPEVNFIPENLDLDQWLSNQKLYGFNTFSKDQAVKLISNLYTIPLYNKSLRRDTSGEDQPFYNLSSKVMEKYVRDYKIYVDLLVKGGIWESDETYSVGTKSKGYRFTSTYSDKRCKTYYNYKYATVKEEFEKTSISSTIEEYKEYSPTVNKLIDYFNNIELDYNSAKNYASQCFNNGCMNVHKYNHAICAMEKIHNNEFFAKQDEYGRLHTNITNLKKDYRKYLTANKETLVSLDLKNSQPFFSTLLLNSSFWEETKDKDEKINLNNLKLSIKTKIKNTNSIIMFLKSAEHNEDVLLYISLVIDGLLYDFFLQELILEGLIFEKRGQAKECIFKIFFSKESHLTTYRPALLFKRLFPSVYELFGLIKKFEHNSLAVLLQGIESQILIEGIAGNLIVQFPDIPIYTIHDSLVVPEKIADSVKKEIVNYIEEKTSNKPSIEVEILR